MSYGKTPNSHTSLFNTLNYFLSPSWQWFYPFWLPFIRGSSATWAKQVWEIVQWATKWLWNKKYFHVLLSLLNFLNFGASLFLVPSDLSKMISPTKQRDFIFQTENCRSVTVQPIALRPLCSRLPGSACHAPGKTSSESRHSLLPPHSSSTRSELHFSFNTHFSINWSQCQSPFSSVHLCTKHPFC